MIKVTIECPHCYTRVIPVGSNTCPSCRKNIGDTRDTNPTLTSMVIGESSLLPNQCYQCNAATTRLVTIRESAGFQGENFFAHVIIFVLGVLSPGIALLAGTGQGTRRLLKIKMPQCENCGKIRKPKPAHVNFETYQVRFIVHKDFRERALAMQAGKLRRLNASPIVE